MGDSHQERDTLGEDCPSVQDRNQEGQGKDHHGADDVDQVVGAKEHHESVNNSLLFLNRRYQCYL